MKAKTEIQGHGHRRFRLRFRLRSLLLLTFLVAISIVSWMAWMAYWESRVHNARRAFQRAHQSWKEASWRLQRGSGSAADEAVARALYFQRREELERIGGGGVRLSASPLVGSWILSDPQGPGSLRELTLESDGRTRSKDSDRSGAALQDLTGTWYVEGETLVIREHRKGIASLLDRLPGIAPIEETEVTIISVSENELLLGDVENPLKYQRGRAKLAVVPH